MRLCHIFAVPGQQKVDALGCLNEVTEGSRMKRPVKTCHGCQWSGVSS